MGRPRHCSVLGASDFREMAGRGSDQRRLQGRWHLGRALKDREVFGRQEVGVWGRGAGPAGAKVGCKGARVALEGAHG